MASHVSSNLAAERISTKSSSSPHTMLQALGWCMLMVGILVNVITMSAEIEDDPPEALPYPTFYSVPDTSFSCEGKWGLFPDPEAGCQAFHFCYGYRMHSFLCPNATLFDANYRVCDHYYNVKC